MNICVIGSGYVGLVTGSCLAEMGNTVWCVDRDKERIRMLNEGFVPIYEPGVKVLIKSNIEQGRLNFTSQIERGLLNCDICFIAVGTPLREDDSTDISNVVAAAKSIGKSVEKYLVIANKSTVPPGTANSVKDIIASELRLRDRANIGFDVVSNPEFLKEGSAIENFMHPDRIILGSESTGAIELMEELYEPFARGGCPIFLMDTKSAEICKYASNAMLASRVSFMNELSRLCDALGADIDNVRKGIGSDNRIGNAYLYPSPGYGGSCLPKDVKGLVQIGIDNGLDMDLISSVDRVNERQKLYLIEMIIQGFAGDLKDKIFGIWGLSFKPKTDDMREAPSIVIIKELLKAGAHIKVYDPVAIEQARRIFENYDDKIDYADQITEAARNADALVIVTEWQEFREVNLGEIKSLMKTPTIFDGRNIFDPGEMKREGFEYYCIGRNRYVK